MLEISKPNLPKNKHAFSLVELLVSLAVVFILISMLFPALSQSAKAAKNLLCKNNLKQIGHGGTIYADDNGGFYFYRKATLNNRVGHPNILKARSGSPWYDDTIAMKDYLSDELTCPYVEKVPIFDTSVNHTYRVYSYSLYFGWRFYSNLPALEKVGDVMTDHQGERYDVVAADYYIYDSTKDLTTSSHPGTGGMSLMTINDDKRSMSYYSGVTNLIDLNFCRSDGSVVYFSDIIPTDDRLKKVSKKINYNTRTRWSLMPSKY